MLLTKVEALREYIQSKGWSISAEKEIAHGYQLVVTDGANKTPINLFKTGKVLIQGKPSIYKPSFDPGAMNDKFPRREQALRAWHE